MFLKCAGNCKYQNGGYLDSRYIKNVFTNWRECVCNFFCQTLLTKPLDYVYYGQNCKAGFGQGLAIVYFAKISINVGIKVLMLEFHWQKIIHHLLLRK